MTQGSAGKFHFGSSRQPFPKLNTPVVPNEVFRKEHFWQKFVSKTRSSYIFCYLDIPKLLRVPSYLPGRAASFAPQSAETEVKNADSRC